jgi:hypothetical protein
VDQRSGQGYTKWFLHDRFECGEVTLLGNLKHSKRRTVGTTVVGGDNRLSLDNVMRIHSHHFSRH